MMEIEVHIYSASLGRPYDAWTVSTDLKRSQTELKKSGSLFVTYFVNSNSKNLAVKNVYDWSFRGKLGPGSPKKN